MSWIPRTVWGTEGWSTLTVQELEQLIYHTLRLDFEVLGAIAYARQKERVSERIYNAGMQVTSKCRIVQGDRLFDSTSKKQKAKNARFSDSWLVSDGEYVLAEARGNLPDHGFCVSF